MGSRLFVSRFFAPKRGSTDDECEDSLRIVPDEPYEDTISRPVLAAMSDGASESMLAGRWSQLLTDLAIEHAEKDLDFFDLGEGFARFATRAGTAWEDWVSRYVADRAAQGRPIRWYEQSKLREGSFATFLVAYVGPAPADTNIDETADASGDTAEIKVTRLEITGPVITRSEVTESDAVVMESMGGGPLCTWRAIALGDTCLFHVRDRVLLTAFPLTRSDDFGRSPDLFGSQNRDVELLRSRTRRSQGQCEAGDHIFLMTDALAAWFLARCELGGVAPTVTTLVHDLSHRDNQEFFQTWVDEQRDAGNLRNDDVAFIHIEVQL